MRKLYWLDNEAWAKIEPHLPRGRRGARRVDDRRVISGNIHMLQSGARWRDCPPEYGPYTTIYNRFKRWSRQGVWQDVFKALTGLSGVYASAAIDSTSTKAHRSAAGAKGAFFHGIGRSRGGRTTKIHALVDEQGRPRVLLLSPGTLADISMEHELIHRAGPFRKLLTDKGYDADHLRKRLAEQQAEAVIPARSRRKHPAPHDKLASPAKHRRTPLGEAEGLPPRRHTI